MIRRTTSSSLEVLLRKSFIDSLNFLIILEGEVMIRNFIHNCHDAVYLQNHYDTERNNHSNDHKWKSDQLANSIEAFMKDGGYEIYC